MKLDAKLDHFYDSVIEDATNQATAIVNDYKNSLKNIYDTQKADELRKARLTLRVETDHLIREKNKTLSAENTEIRKEISLKTIQLKDELFDDIKDKLIHFMKTEAYTQLLIKQIKEAINFSREDPIIIYINSSDAAQKQLLELETGISLKISTIDFIGGSRAVIHSKNILIDNSFLTKLAEEKERFTF
ncbi:V-type ATP synthase subunit E [Lachnospiraceae bacterium KM106-2]|nr:V-type ATP synthase subunit E [Lachnospiraceae bacterium KM106-2]